MSQECYLAVTFLSGAGGLVEAEPFHITNQHVDNAPLELPIAARGVAHAPLHERRHAPVRHVRLGLQDRGQSNFRRHFLRGLRRFATLLVGDLASFYIMRALVRAVRDSATVGPEIATQVLRWLPVGILNGWQYAAALFVGLLVLGNYGPGDQRRDPKRLFLACALATALPLWMTIWTRGLEMVAVQSGLRAGLGVPADRLRRYPHPPCARRIGPYRRLRVRRA